MNHKAAPIPVLECLRAATRESHRALEQLTPFFTPSFDRPAYLRWLDLMHGFYGRVDAAVAASGFCADTGWQYVPRTRLIANDLHALAGREPAPPGDPSGLLGRITALRTPGEIAGLLYVVEGSTLGGAVILASLARLQGVTAGAGGTTFAPHGANPRARWDEYVQLLSRLSDEPGMQEDAAASAETAFLVLRDWVTHFWQG